MSIEEWVKPEADCSAIDCTKTKLVITPKQKDLGGFFVRRLPIYLKAKYYIAIRWVHTKRFDLVTLI